MNTLEKTKTKKQEKEDALKQLREWMPRGTTVYTILRHVSKSGMTRHISLVLLAKDGERIIPVHPNWTVAKAMGWTLVNSHGSNAIKVGGCGMDMGHHLVYSISMALYGKDAADKYDPSCLDALKQEWL